MNRQELDGRSDLYAVGVVLWELLAHQRLRVGPPGDRQAQVIFQDIPRPSVYRPDVPADLEAVAMRLLAYDRWARYQTADLAAQDLVRCQDALRDGRSDLVRLLDERFPRSRRRRRACSFWSWAGRVRARSPWRTRRCRRARHRARGRNWSLDRNAESALLLATAIALLVAR